MIDKYYQQELSHLRQLAAEFAAVHPGLAPLLAGQSADPDVERILEGTAFLAGLLNEKLDSDFPEILHGLIQLIFPHYLSHIPAATLIQFTPKPSLRQYSIVKQGTAIDSLETQGTRCTFTTCQEVELSPITITNVVFTAPGAGHGLLRIDLSLGGLDLRASPLKTLRLHLAGVYTEASQRNWLILTHVRDLRLIAPDGTVIPLGTAALTPVGFKETEALLPYPTRSFPGYRILQEYFALPEKFLFFDVTGLAALSQHGVGTGFSLEFEFANLPAAAPPMRREHFQLFVTPALNLFPHHTDPLLLDHRRPDYLLRPSGANPRHYQIHSVTKVTGFIQGGVSQRDYLPFEHFNPQAEAKPVYALHHRLAPIGGQAELYLSVADPGAQGVPKPETLSIEALCSNAALPETLRAGDIRMPTESSPILADFANLSSPTAQVQPPLGKNVLWRLLSHVFLNYQSLAAAENLRAMLKLYIFQETRNREAVLANTKRIEAIDSLDLRAADRFLQGYLLRGQEINIQLRLAGFIGEGDLFLFGSILDVFLGNYAAINSFTKMTVEDTNRKLRFTWPARLGDRVLL
ncbi:type VI secretion system baseplate subunit TssF [uncultured Thiodictyon sp.]|uniref:type VI secretion system baseplate subunit TssF n=1 Tax=uncultured Thiodictyon sp. TaxID=1846217 RepID=UPI0025E0C2C6|nr:type VI secretion system baseplate subunit TssF [uncultured Thiodictyon sp.]